MKTHFFTSTGLLAIIAVSQFLLFFNSCTNKPKITCALPDNITYKKDIAVVIEEKCFMCHAPDVYKRKASRNKIFNYKSLKKMAESGQLMGSITHAQGFIAMPYKKGSKIDTCSIAIIDKWIKTGMKQ